MVGDDFNDFLNFMFIALSLEMIQFLCLKKLPPPPKRQKSSCFFSAGRSHGQDMTKRWIHPTGGAVEVLKSTLPDS